MSLVADERKLGTVLGGRYQVRFKSLRTRRMPDFIFVSNRHCRILKNGVCDGPPDLILEIASKESLVRDIREKFCEYEKMRVQEYWIAIPEFNSIVAYALGADKKYKEIVERDGKLCSKVFKGFYFRPKWVETSEFPRIMPLLREMKLVK